MKKIDSNDLMFFSGLVCTAIGLWLWSPALSLTVSGVILMLLFWFRAGGE